MTASQDTNTTSDNSDPTGRVLNADEQLIVDYLRSVDHATLEGLAAKTEMPKAHLQDILDGLQANGFVTVHTGFRSVRIRACDRRETVADGGYVQRLIDVVGSNRVDLDIPAGDVFAVLSSRRRRSTIRVLAVLAGGDTEDDPEYLELADLARALVKAQLGLRSIEDVPTDEYHRAYTALCQTHLPLLDDVGIVEYYQRPQQLRATERAVEVAQLMELVADRCDGSEPAREGLDGQ